MASIKQSALALMLGFAFSSPGIAATTIPFWHSMEGQLGEEVNDLVTRFNETHPDYKVVPTYKGNYEQSLAAGIAAFRSGNSRISFR